MNDALQQSGWHNFEARRAAALSRGKLRGIGMANYVERCGGGGGLSEAATLRFSADGVLTILIGTMSNGQGHETAYSQILHEQMGLPFEKIRLLQGDTDQIGSGHGTGGSWSVPMGGGAVLLAGENLLEKARHIAAHLLETAVSDIEFSEGEFHVVGTDVRIGLDQVVQAAFDPARLPSGSTPGLAGEARYKPANHTFPHGCHICEVEIDHDTGALTLIDYIAVHDFGRALNPLLLAGQVHGGVTQGIGQALFEHTVYDSAGQLLSGSFMDYCLPRADDLPAFDFQRRETPSPHNPLGIKGCGEAGATGSPPAVINAVVDAFAPFGLRHIDMPATPETLWKLCKSS
jgi:carbon-monoxide dehydrogenase large subunit